MAVATEGRPLQNEFLLSIRSVPPKAPNNEARYQEHRPPVAGLHAPGIPPSMQGGPGFPRLRSASKVGQWPVHLPRFVLPQPLAHSWLLSCGV
jgi:hypothetical protein